MALSSAATFDRGISTEAQSRPAGRNAGMRENYQGGTQGKGASGSGNRNRLPNTKHKNFQRRFEDVKNTARITSKHGAEFEKAQTHRGRLRKRYDEAASATKLALAYREEIAKGNFFVFIPALAIAIAKDAIFDEIPILGTLFGFFAAVFLLVFLWGKGRWKVRFVIFILSFIDLIPGVGLLPLETIAVLYAYYQAKKDVSEAEEKLAELNAAMSK